jgi:two-component system, OmpR family, response regulator CpxR
LQDECRFAFFPLLTRGILGVLVKQKSESGSAESSHTLLLVDDDVELCELMVDFFSQHGFRIESAYDGRRGLARALEGVFDLVLLDVMLPGLDGFEVLHQLRRQRSVPVIMLTARTEQADRISGLNAGADDYLPKPFGPEELLARIRAVLRRASQSGLQAPKALQAGTLRLDSATRQVWRDTTRLELTSVEFEILSLLMRSAGRSVSRDEIAGILYHREALPFERAIDVHVSHLRKKLEHQGHSMIRTVRGVGYLFCADPGPES